MLLNTLNKVPVSIVIEPRRIFPLSSPIVLPSPLALPSSNPVSVPARTATVKELQAVYSIPWNDLSQPSEGKYPRGE